MSEYIVGGPFEHDDVFVANMGAERTHLYGYELREEIVRCRDCRFCHKNYCEKRVSPTASPSEIYWIPVEPDGFCKWGARRPE